MIDVLFIALFCLGLVGLAADWWMHREPKRNQRLDMAYELWKALPVDLEFAPDEQRDGTDQ